MAVLFGSCALLYLSIYAFEGPIRYALINFGLGDAIVLRDGLIILPIVLLLMKQAFRFRVHPAFFLFAGIVLLHGTLSTANLHTPLPALYAATRLLHILFGFIAARQLLRPGNRVLWVLTLVWLASVAGVALTKFVYTMPWTGLEAEIGGVTVDVSRGWDIIGFDKPAAGFFRSATAAAVLLPMLGLLLGARTRSWPIRALVLGLTVGAVVLTTQTASIIAIAMVGLLMFAPSRLRYTLLCTACVGFAALDVALPLVAAGMVASGKSGALSFGLFDTYIGQTWADAWKWIASNGIFPFGVGLGRIGSAQRLSAEDLFDPFHNLFVFLYANFGLLGAVYLAWVVCQGLRLPEKVRPAAIGPLAILAFNLAAGAALAMLDDQMSALFTGASVGMLFQLRQMAVAGRWRDPYAGNAHASPAFEQPVHARRQPLRLP